jgi:thiol-disulfide isomerase/thioredoxin
MLAAALPAESGPVLPEGTPAPQIKFKTLDGKTLSIRSLCGHIVIVDYWATWCGPCRMGLPQLESLYKKYRKRGVVVIGIPVDEPPTRPLVAKMVKQFAVTFPVSVSWNANQQAAADYNASKLPSIFLIDRKGVVRWSGQGVYPDEDNDVGAMIDYLLTEK